MRSPRLAALVPLLLLAGCPPRDKEPAKAPPAANAGTNTPPAAPVGSFVSARRATLRRWVSAVGSLRARQTTRLGPQVSGRVVEVQVDVGQHVTKGQPLVLLDRVPFELEVAQRKADVAAAKVQVDDAALTLTRMENLWQKPAGDVPTISRKSVDDARTRHEATLAALAQAQAALEVAHQRASECTIRAPWDGVVTARLVDPGEPVTATPVTHVLELMEVSTLELEFSLPQRLRGDVHEGTRVEFEVEGATGGAAREAKVALVYPSLDEATRTFRSRAYVDNAQGELRPGFLVRVRVVESEARSVLVIPARAVRRTARGHEVLAGAPDAKARAVEVGLVEEDLAEVRAGLAEGDLVLVPGGGP